MVSNTNSIDRLADKALDVLHHLARRGSVWPEASATAVREIRDRITQRSARSSGTEYNSSTHQDSSLHTARASNLVAPMQPPYTRSNGLEVPTGRQSNEQIHSTSSTGLGQEIAGSSDTQSTAVPPNVFVNAIGQAPDAPKPSEQVQNFDNAPSIAMNNINTPIFDFGDSEWSDYLQANELFDANAPLSQLDAVDPYIGFDIPFWLGQDQYWDILHERN